MSLAESTTSATHVACVASEGFQTWLSETTGSLVVSTYQAGKVAFASWAGRQAGVMLRHFDRPMGLGVSTTTRSGGVPASPELIAVATRRHLLVYANASELAPEYPLEPAPSSARRFRSLFLPRAAYYTGDLNLHDVAFVDDGLVAVNTRFSCLVRPSERFAFEPFWQPRFISELMPEDRCHLNGLALRNGQPAFVSALGATNQAGGWRADRTSGGLLIDVPSGETVRSGLCMPHSPRWRDDCLWFLNSGAGELCRLDPARDDLEVVCTLSGYLRGLAFVGNYALIGLSKIREKHTFAGLPVQQRSEPLHCGIAVVDLRVGRAVGLLEFTSGCEELYDVQWLPEVQSATILGPDDPVAGQAIPAPEYSYWMLPQAESDA